MSIARRRNHLRPAPDRRSGRLAQVTPSFALTYRAMFGTRQFSAPAPGPLDTRSVSAGSARIVLLAGIGSGLVSAAGYEYSERTADGDRGQYPDEVESARRLPVDQRHRLAKPSPVAMARVTASGGQKNGSPGKSGRFEPPPATARVAKATASEGSPGAGKQRGQPAEPGSAQRRLLAAGADPDRDRPARRRLDRLRDDQTATCRGRRCARFAASLPVLLTPPYRPRRARRMRQRR